MFSEGDARSEVARTEETETREGTGERPRRRGASGPRQRPARSAYVTRAVWPQLCHDPSFRSSSLAGLGRARLLLALLRLFSHFTFQPDPRVRVDIYSTVRYDVNPRTRRTRRSSALCTGTRNTHVDVYRVAGGSRGNRARTVQASHIVAAWHDCGVSSTAT